MEITDASTYREIMEIAKTDKLGKEFTWEGVLHTPDGDYILDDMRAMVIEREYVSRYSDRQKLLVNIPYGDYIQKIYPHKGFLEITIRYMPLVKNTINVDDNKKTTSFKYRAVLMNQDSKGLQGSSVLTADQRAGNYSKREAVEFQLIEPIIDKIRNKTISGIFRGTQTNLLKTLLRTDFLEEPRKHNVPLWFVRKGTVSFLAGVDVIPPDNNPAKMQWIIPNGTRVMDLARFIQDRYGIYEHGVGSYVERGEWYVWSLYNTKRFEESPATLTVAIADKQKLPTSDSSFTVENATAQEYEDVEWRKQHRHVKAIVQSDGAHIDVSEARLQTEGNGVRYLNLDSLIDNYAVTKKGVTTISRANNLREYMVEKRDDGLNYVAPAQNHTSNHWREMSRLQERRGTILHVEWHNSDPDVLYPGMPVKVLYSDHKDVRALYGILVAGRHGFSAESEQFTDNRIRSNTVLSIWLDRDIE